VERTVSGRSRRAVDDRRRMARSWGVSARVLQGQGGPGSRRLLARRRLRSLCPCSGPSSGQAHSRTSDSGDPEHAGGGFGEGRQLPLQCGSQGRHSDGHLRSGPSDGAAARPHRRPAFRRHQIHLDRQRHGRTQHLRFLAQLRHRQLAGYEDQALQGGRKRFFPSSAARSTGCAAGPGRA
jgi:hypothetical protein